MANEKKKPHKGIENLKSLKDRTTEEQRAIASKGGKASQKKQKEKKLMSQIYAEFLIEKHDVKMPGNKAKEEMTGYKMINMAVKEIIKKGGPPAVSIMKEIREATEGNKLDMTSGGKPLPVKININPVKPDTDEQE